MNRGHIYLLLTFITIIGFNTVVCSAEDPSITVPEMYINYPQGTEQIELTFSVTTHDVRDLFVKLYDKEYSELNFTTGFMSGFSGSYSFTRSFSEWNKLHILSYYDLPAGTYTITLVFDVQSNAEGGYPLNGCIQVSPPLSQAPIGEDGTIIHWGCIAIFDKTYCSFTASSETFTMDLYEPFEATISIKNTGATPDSYDYRLSLNTCTYGRSDVINPGETGTLTVSADPHGFQVPGYYTRTLRIYSHNDPTEYRDIYLRFKVIGYFIDGPKSYLYGWVGDDPFNPSPTYSYELGTPKTVDFHVENLGSAGDTAIVTLDKGEYWVTSRDYFEADLSVSETYTGSLTATLQDDGVDSTNGGSLIFNFNGKDYDVDTQFRDTWASMGLVTYDLSYTVTQVTTTTPNTVKFELTAPNYVNVFMQTKYCKPYDNIIGVSAGVTKTIELSYDHIKPGIYTDTIVFTGNGITTEKSVQFSPITSSTQGTILIVPRSTSVTVLPNKPVTHVFDVMYYGESGQNVELGGGGAFDEVNLYLFPLTKTTLNAYYPGRSAGGYTDTFNIQLYDETYASTVTTNVLYTAYFTVTPDAQYKYLDSAGKAFFELTLSNIDYDDDSYTATSFSEGVFTPSTVGPITGRESSKVTLEITVDLDSFFMQKTFPVTFTSVSDPSKYVTIMLQVVKPFDNFIRVENAGTSSEKVAVIGDRVEHVFQLINQEESAKTYSVTLSGAGLIEGVGDSVSVEPFTSTLLKVIHPSGNEDIFQSTITVADDGGKTSTVTAKTYVVSPERYSSTTISSAGEHTHSFTIDGYTIDLTIDASEPIDPFTVSLYQLSREAHPEISLDGTSLVNGFIHWSDPAPINSISVSVTFDQEQSGDLELLAWTGEEYVSITPKSVNRMKMAWDLKNMDAETDNLHSYMMRVKAIDQPIPVPGYIWFIGLAITMVYMTLRKPKTSIL